MKNGILLGKRGIIFGALNDKSIAWKVAEKAVEEGAQITISNTAMACRMGEVKALAEKLNCELIQADATNYAELVNVFEKSQEILGGKIDFVLHSIGMSPNVRKAIPYDDINYDFMNKTIDISALSFHKMLSAAKKTDVMNEYGSILALTYIAGERAFVGYSDMADAKAMLQSITRNFGYIFGKERKVRVNTISQSPTMTTAGTGIKGMSSIFDYADKLSPLGNATADDCANYCVMMFSDYTRKVTMQNLYHDGGFSTMGMSAEVMEIYDKGVGLEK